MLCAIGYIFASIFRGKGLGGLAGLIIMEFLFVDWWLLPILLSKWK